MSKTSSFKTADSGGFEHEDLNMKILKFKQSAIMQIQVHLNDAEYQNE